jgi:hypothetical protein
MALPKTMPLDELRRLNEESQAARETEKRASTPYPTPKTGR